MNKLVESAIRVKELESKIETVKMDYDLQRLKGALKLAQDIRIYHSLKNKKR